MAKQYKDYKARVLGKAYDVDGYYGSQCWDGYADYSKWLGYPYFSCTSSGYVKDIYLNRRSSGILNYFDEVEVLKPGDVVIFKEVAAYTPYSHIAIFDSDAGGGFGLFLGQNQGGINGCYNLVKLPYSATYTYGLRPKVYSQTTSQDKPAVYSWDPDAVLKVGDVVKSSSLKITAFNPQNETVNVPDLGGYVPWKDVKEASNTGDGSVDQILANLNARVYLAPTTVQQVDAAKNLVKVNGYWVKPDKLYKRIS